MSRKSYKVMEGTRWHKRKLQLFERGPARWASGVALQPRLKTFLMVAFNEVRSRFFSAGQIHSRVLTFWSQSPHLLILELHQANTAVVHRHSHQLELKFYSPVPELPAPLNLYLANKWDVNRILGAAARSCSTRSFSFSTHSRNGKQILHNELCGESDFEIRLCLPDRYLPHLSRCEKSKSPDPPPHDSNYRHLLRRSPRRSRIQMQSRRV